MLLARFRSKLETRRFVEHNFNGRRVGSARIFSLLRVPPHLAIFYDFVLRGLTRAVQENETAGDFFVGFAKHMSGLPTTAFKILIQHEQTVLSYKKPQDGAFPGAIEEDGEGNYLVRLLGPEQGYVVADAIIDYSNVNVHNVLASDRSYLYRGKAHYVAPLLGDATKKPSPKKEMRVSTMFGSPHLGRRAELLAKLEGAGIAVDNINDYRNYDNAFSRTSILLNYRQFSHFQTFEELRVLPALMRGVLVISERGPLWEIIPYGHLITTFDNDDIVPALALVKETYKHIWSEVFREKFPHIVSQLDRENQRVFDLLARKQAFKN